MIDDHNEEWEATINMGIEGVRALRGLLDYANQTWPGSPARPPEEQEFIWALRDVMNKLVLEYTFDNAEMSNGREET